jgi:small GTP-binding protein
MIARRFDVSVKIIVVGESGVGKTCLLVRFVRDTFDEDAQPTLGIEFLSKIVQTETRRIQMQLWDTAGQELFRSVTRGYYRGSAGALVLFDLTNRHSFQNIEQWVHDVTAAARNDVVLVLIGNKSDLESNRQVPADEAEELALRVGMRYFEVSAKTGENVALAVGCCLAGIEKTLNTGNWGQDAPDHRDKSGEEAIKGCC